MNYLELKQIASRYGLPCLSDAQVYNLAAFMQEACNRAITDPLKQKAENEFLLDDAAWSSFETAASISSSAFESIYKKLD